MENKDNSRQKAQQQSKVWGSRPSTLGEHSMEFVAEINGVSYVNDSKSVSIKSTYESINTIDAHLVLIIGGMDKDTDYSYLLNVDMNKIKTFIYLGENEERMLRYFGRNNMLFMKADGIEEALTLAKASALANQVVLFSPACPSFEIFDNYKNRGNRFKEQVKLMMS